MVLSRSSLLAMIPLISITLLLIGPASYKAQEQGDWCVVNNSPGVCLRIQQCPPIYNNLLKGQFPRTVCGYSSFEPIVCCPRRSTTFTSTTTTTTTTTPPPTQGWGAKARKKCKEIYDSIPKFIVGGTKAVVKEFTFMAAVGFGPDIQSITWLCGGSLITDTFVVTAAHCTYNTNWGEANWVRLGELNLERLDENQDAATYRVIQRIRHPWYRRPSEYHDIALLRLEKPVVFTPWIKPCCLASTLPDTDASGKAIAIGWGQTDWAGERSSDLLKVTLDIVPQPQCNRSFTNGAKDSKLEFGIVGDWQICAGGLGKDTCQGDSGGPLVVLDSQPTALIYNLIGVTSLGKLCGSITPGIYTRVYNYVPWIEDVVWPDS